MNVKFITTTTQKLADGQVPKIAGQIIALSDAVGYFYDMYPGNVNTGNLEDVVRYPATGHLEVASIPSPENAILGLMYVIKEGKDSGVYVRHDNVVQVEVDGQLKDVTQSSMLCIASMRLDAFGITVSADDINQLDCIEDNVQKQLDDKVEFDKSGEGTSGKDSTKKSYYYGWIVDVEGNFIAPYTTTDQVLDKTHDDGTTKLTTTLKSMQTDIARAIEHADKHRGIEKDTGFYKIKTNVEGHVVSVEAVTAEDINKLQGTVVDKLRNARTISISGDASGSTTFDGSKDVDIRLSLTEDYLKRSERGAANGVASLGADGQVPAAQLPSYVDDVLEVYIHEGKAYNTYDAETKAHSELVSGEGNKIYVDLHTSNTYRYSGTSFVEISKSLALGETSSTAYAGDKGKALKEKLDTVEEGANKYIHPDNHQSGMIMYSNDMPTVNALGGIAAGTTFNNMTVEQVLNKLLYPYIAPVITAKASPNGGTYEKGSSVNVSTITATVTKKSEAITKVEVFDGSTSLGSNTDGTAGNITFTVNQNVTSNKTFAAKVTDASGNTVSANTGTFSFVYPYYLGAIDVESPTEELVEGLTKLIEAKGNKTKPFNADNQFMVFAYPTSYGNIKTILDPNSFDVTATWTKHTLNITGLDGTSQSYNVYVSKQVTVSNYNMTFKY